MSNNTENENRQVSLSMEVQKQGKGIASLFLQIDDEKMFVNAISNDVADPAIASLIWHSMLSLFEHCDETTTGAIDVETRNKESISHI
jgi:hypothetical protein